MNYFISLESICSSHFEPVSTDMSCLTISSTKSVVVDVNDDDQLVLIFYCATDQSLNTLLGNGNNGTFQERNKYLFYNNILICQSSRFNFNL